MFEKLLQNDCLKDILTICRFFELGLNRHVSMQIFLKEYTPLLSNKKLTKKTFGRPKMSEMSCNVGPQKHELANGYHKTDLLINLDFVRPPSVQNSNQYGP